MQSNAACAAYQAEQMFSMRSPDNADLVEGSPVAMDLTEISGGTRNDGGTVTDEQAVASFIAVPSALNARAFLGVLPAAIATGQQKRVVDFGTCAALVKNEGSASLTLAVGDLLYQKPGSAFLVPSFQPVSAGTSLLISNHGCFARAMVRKAATITAGTTSLVQVYLWPATPPRLQVFEYYAGDDPALTSTFAGIASGPGLIVRAGLGNVTASNAGTLELDVLINGTSIFTNKPKLAVTEANFHSLASQVAPGAGTGPGTGGIYGLIDVTKNILALGDKITFSLTNASTFIGKHCHVQIERLMF